MPEHSLGAVGCACVLASPLHAHDESIAFAVKSAERQSDAEGHLRGWGKMGSLDNPAAMGALGQQEFLGCC